MGSQQQTDLELESFRECWQGQTGLPSSQSRRLENEKGENFEFQGRFPLSTSD